MPEAAPARQGLSGSPSGPETACTTSERRRSTFKTALARRWPPWRPRRRSLAVRCSALLLLSARSASSVSRVTSGAGTPDASTSEGSTRGPLRGSSGSPLTIARSTGGTDDAVAARRAAWALRCLCRRSQSSTMQSCGRERIDGDQRAVRSGCKGEGVCFQTRSLLSSSRALGRGWRLGVSGAPHQHRRCLVCGAWRAPGAEWPPWSSAPHAQRLKN